MDFPELYDAQIEALLEYDYDKFCELIDKNRRSDIIDCHKAAWANTGKCEDSLFAYLPQCSYCASEIEHEEDNELIDRKVKMKEVREEVLKNKPMSLPDMHEQGSYAFSREELEEFKRRQLVARGYI